MHFKRFRRPTQRQLVLGTLSVLILLAAVSFWLVKHSVKPKYSSTKTGSKPTTVVSPTPSTTPQVTATPLVTEAPASWPVHLSSEQAASLTVVVNKKHQLPADYAPQLTAVGSGQMRPEAAAALESLMTAAGNQAVSLKIISSYRSYATQQSTYNGYVNQYGQAAADTFSARPGFSEHQTGLAVDLGAADGSCDLEICFEDTTAGQWIKNNAVNYGFIVRYPKGRESETGYQYEPWHLRFLGTDIAGQVQASGKTLDEFYGIEAGGY